MDSMQSISSCLISSRNILLDGRSNENVLTCLNHIVENLSCITLKEINNIFQYCVKEAIAQVLQREFLSAGLILNLIHNLPLSEIECKRWDVDYFLSVELIEFLENFDVIKSSKEVLMVVFGQLAAMSFAGSVVSARGD